jgi:dipeptidyl aminopeptidase/acylaminoacyl peptidase
MAVPVEGGAVRPYSAGSAVDRALRWSPDGATLAFLSNRPHNLPEDAHAAETQLYLLPRDGGEARRLTAVQSDIQDVTWAPDGSRLILLMPEPEPDEERKRREERGDAIDVEARPRHWRLWGADVATGDLTPLTPAGLQVWGFGLAPDGRTAALVVSDLPYEWSWYNARLAVAPLDASEMRTIYTTPRQLAHPRFSPDGTTIAVTSCTWSDRGYYGGDVLLIPAAGGEARNLTAGQAVSITWAEWEPDGRSLLCCGFEEGEVGLWRLGVDGHLHTP